MKKLLITILVLIAIAAWAGLTKAGYIDNYFEIEWLSPEKTNTNGPWAKPVIFLYPQSKQLITVKLNFKGEINSDYPNFDSEIGGWQVVAYPDGRLINQADGQEYAYLFWEGIPEKEVDWDLSSGFIVKGSDTREFLQKTLADVGLTPKEYNEFIVYWYPKMKNNKYNLVHFAGKEYTNTAPLKITPKPDSMLRVFMVFKPLKEKIDIPEQQFEKFERKGFTVVEWGGSEI